MASKLASSKSVRRLPASKKVAPLRIPESGKVNSAAADWSVFPVGTKFRITGDDTIYEVDDYGSALVGTRTIDLYKPTLSSMRAWGVRHVDIEIVRFGCFEKSLEIMEPRETKAKHVKQMATSIRRRKI